jgi:AraC family transcriptional regulator
LRRGNPFPRRREDIYPSLPPLDSHAQDHTSAASLTSVRHLQTEPTRMPEDVFAERHVLLNVQETPHRA